MRKRPNDISSSSRIVNYNVRGRRGNIVQVGSDDDKDKLGRPTSCHKPLQTEWERKWLGKFDEVVQVGAVDMICARLGPDALKTQW